MMWSGEDDLVFGELCRWGRFFFPLGGSKKARGKFGEGRALGGCGCKQVWPRCSSGANVNQIARGCDFFSREARKAPRAGLPQLAPGQIRQITDAEAGRWASERVLAARRSCCGSRYPRILRNAHGFLLVGGLLRNVPAAINCLVTLGTLDRPGELGSWPRCAWNADPYW